MNPPLPGNIPSEPLLPTPPKPETSKPRIIYLDVLRICAFFGVICIHVASLCWYDLTLPGWGVVNFYDCVFRACSSVTFVMISGAIFLNPARTVTIKKAWGKYAARIFRVLLVWGFFYYAVFQAPGQAIDGNYFYQFMVKFFSGDLYFHLWFLYMIAGLYMVTPLVKFITAKATQQELGYFILLAFVCFCVSPYLELIFPGNIASVFLDKLQIGLGGGYLLYFLCGHYFHTYPLPGSQRALLYAAGILGAAATTWLTYSLSMEAGYGVDTYMNRLSLNIFMAAIALFVLVKYAINRLNPGEKLQRLVKMLSDNSFGIYLLHMFFVIEYRDNGGAQIIGANPLSQIPLTALCIFLISLACIWLIRKIPYIGKKIT